MNSPVDPHLLKSVEQVVRQLSSSLHKFTLTKDQENKILDTLHILQDNLMEMKERLEKVETAVSGTTDRVERIEDRLQAVEQNTGHDDRRLEEMETKLKDTCSRVVGRLEAAEQRMGSKRSEAAKESVHAGKNNDQSDTKFA